MDEHYNILTVLIALEKQVRSKELMNIKSKRKTLLLDGEITNKERTKSALSLNSTSYSNRESSDFRMIQPNRIETEEEGVRRQTSGNTSKQTDKEVKNRKITVDLNKETEPEITNRKITGDLNKETESEIKNRKFTGDLNKQIEIEVKNRKNLREVKPRDISPFSKTERAKVSSSLSKKEKLNEKLVRPKTTQMSSLKKPLDRNLQNSKKTSISSSPKQEMNKRNRVKYSCKDAEKIYLKNTGSLCYSHFYGTKKPVEWTMLRRLTNYGFDSVDLVSAANKPENLKLPSLICCPPLMKSTNQTADKSSQCRSKSQGN